MLLKQSYHDILNKTDRCLCDAVTNKLNDFRQLVIASHLDSSIQMRSVVLRHWNMKRRSIFFFSDSRSPKIKELEKNNNCSILFYSRKKNIQLRFSCHSHVHKTSRLHKYFYSSLSENQKKMYQLKMDPSKQLDCTNSDVIVQDYNHVDTGKNYFSVVVCNFNQLEFLELKHKKSIRVKFSWDKKNNLSAYNIGI